jgi:gamma-glutamylcyclotransferase (GGCT)/AIG2-like uncharacterized protein YtfP
MKLIVYGTLMRGESNQHMMKGAEYICDVSVPNAALWDLGGYPGLMFLPIQHDTTYVHGELYEVSKEHMKDLDRFEGVPTLYDRRECKYEVTDGYLNGHAYIYEYQGEMLMYGLIESGNWKER